MLFLLQLATDSTDPTPALSLDIPVSNLVVILLVMLIFLAININLIVKGFGGARKKELRVRGLIGGRTYRGRMAQIVGIAYGTFGLLMSTIIVSFFVRFFLPVLLNMLQK